MFMTNLGNGRKRDMPKITFRHPKWCSENSIDIQGAKLDSAIRCQHCDAVLEANELHTSTIKVTDKNNKVVKEYTLFLCFNCIHKLIGRRLEHEQKRRN